MKSHLLSPGGLDVVAISLWDIKEYAEAYKTAGYPEVLKILHKSIRRRSQGASLGCD